MLLTVPGLLSAHQAAELRAQVVKAPLRSGQETGSATLKDNLQGGATDPALSAATQVVLQALSQNVDFNVFALPKSYNMMFNRYDPGMFYKPHMDQSLMYLGTPSMMRTDLSFTVFLTEPQDYEGGEFVVETPFGEKRFKEPAGTLICYPSDMLHGVEPVRSGSRISAIGWIHSLVPDAKHREIFNAFDNLGHDVLGAVPDPEQFRDRFARLRDNLLRAWCRI
ncbi:MAG: Fe2+-dependent dioxygenase [Rhodospirillales bacterium]